MSDTSMFNDPNAKLTTRGRLEKYGVKAEPVEWHKFNGCSLGDCVAYALDGVTYSTDIHGRYYRGRPSDADLVPLPVHREPKYRPWQTADEVPDGIWIKTNNGLYQLHGFRLNESCLIIDGRAATWLFDHATYHTDRRALTGWKKCGVEITE